MPAKPKHPTLKAAEKIMGILSDLPQDQAEIVMELVRNLWETEGETVVGMVIPNKSSGSDVTNF